MTDTKPDSPSSPAVGSAKPKITLSFLAQQYGLTAEDCAKEFDCSVDDIILDCSVDDIIIEPQPNAALTGAESVPSNGVVGTLNQKGGGQC